MAKKITMRDIAKECNVSVATVSYVLNHCDKEKISSDTYLKVTETATRLHYCPGHSNENHIGRSSNLVGIVINLKKANTQSKKSIYYDLAAELSSQLKLINFDSVLMLTDDLSADFASMSKRSFDAVFMIDIDNENFLNVTHRYNVPIIFLNSDVDDDLFCKIRPDYKNLILKSKAMLKNTEPVLIIEDILCQNIKYELNSHFFSDDIFINDPYSNLKHFLDLHPERKMIIIGDMLASEVFQLKESSDAVVITFLDSCSLLPPKVKKINISNKRIAAAAVKTLSEMLKFQYNSKEENRILIDCE